MLPTINMIETGKNISKMRKQHGLSVKDLQGIFGFATPQAIYKWQYGTTIPSIDNLVILSEIFNMPINDIIVVDNPKGE